MTKETRIDVSSSIKTVEDLQPGDKVVVVYRRGLQITTKVVYTFGSVQNGMIKTETFEDVMGAEMFNKVVGSYDSAFTTVWRKAKPLPTQVGAIIHVDETADGVRDFTGLLILRHAGSWQGINNPTYRFGANNIKRWSPVKIEVTN